MGSRPPSPTKLKVSRKRRGEWSRHVAACTATAKKGISLLWFPREPWTAGNAHTRTHMRWPVEGGGWGPPQAPHLQRGDSATHLLGQEKTTHGMGTPPRKAWRGYGGTLPPHPSPRCIGLRPQRNRNPWGACHPESPCSPCVDAGGEVGWWCYDARLCGRIWGSGLHGCVWTSHEHRSEKCKVGLQTWRLCSEGTHCPPGILPHRYLLSPTISKQVI